jgi:TRAP-type C4-dicarboxylate transport system substrate-binding protein
MDILELPYAFPSLKQADKTLDKVRPLVEQMLEEKGMMLLMYSENGYRSMATQDKCVKSPADLKAVKMRSQESDVHLETYRALGASPVPIPVSEVLTSLQTGIVKGFDIYQPALIVMNKKWFDSLSPEHQAIMREHGKKLEKIGRKKVRKLTPILMQNFKTMGVEVCELTDAERAAFKAATKGVWDKRAAKASDLGKELIKQLR